MTSICIAIDGPASSGKSTVAKEIAKRLNIIYLDTGAMYRCMTLYCLNNNIDLNNESVVADVIQQQRVTFETNQNEQRVFLNDEDVTDAIRFPNVTANVSLVSSYQGVRKELVKRQQQFIQNGGIVMDGRDIGTVVMPNAPVKIFMVASAYERAKRRFEENHRKGIATQSIEQLQQDIQARDLFDSTRKVTPLVKATDAIEIDTTHLTIEQVVHEILEIVANYEKNSKIQ